MPVNSRLGPVVLDASGAGPIEGIASPRRIVFIQSLRGIAALMVTIFHIMKEAHRQGNLGEGAYKFSTTFVFGVDLFFIISGFIMIYMMNGKPNGPRVGLDFFIKRVLRIAPLYWMFTLLTALMIAALPQVMHASQIDLPYLAASLAFIPWPSANNASLQPVLGLGWTLSYEMFFYLIFATLIALSVRRQVTALCVIFFSLVFMGQWIGIDHPQLWYWTRSTLISFALGAIVAKLFLSGRWQVPEWMAIGILLLGITAWQLACWNTPAFDENWRGFVLSLPAAMIVFGIMRSRVVEGALSSDSRFNPLPMIGDTSYSLYLSHIFTLRVVTLLCGKFIPNISFVVFFVIGLVTCIVTAVIVHRLAEKPLLRLGKLPIFRTRSATAIV